VSARSEQQRGLRDKVPARLFASSLRGAHVNGGDLPDDSNAFVSRAAHYRQNHNCVRDDRDSIELALRSRRYPVRTGIWDPLPVGLPIDDCLRGTSGPRRILRPRPSDQIDCHIQLGQRYACIFEIG